MLDSVCYTSNQRVYAQTHWFIITQLEAEH
jgi:hypothetical protein